MFVFAPQSQLSERYVTFFSFLLRKIYTAYPQFFVFFEYALEYFYFQFSSGVALFMKICLITN